MIKKLETERAAIDDALVSDVELRKQGDLRFSPDQATKALAQVGAAAGEVKPSNPHAFDATGAKGLSAETCKQCGAGEADPVHAIATTTETSTPGGAPAEESERARGNGGNGRAPIVRANARKISKRKAGRRKPKARA